MVDQWWFRALLFAGVAIYAGTGAVLELVDNIKWQRFKRLYELASPAKAPETPLETTETTE